MWHTLMTWWLNYIEYLIWIPNKDRHYLIYWKILIFYDSVKCSFLFFLEEMFISMLRTSTIPNFISWYVIDCHFDGT